MRRSFLIVISLVLLQCKTLRDSSTLQDIQSDYFLFHDDGGMVMAYECGGGKVSSRNDSGCQLAKSVSPIPSQDLPNKPGSGFYSILKNRLQLEDEPQQLELAVKERLANLEREMATTQSSMLKKIYNQRIAKLLEEQTANQKHVAAMADIQLMLRSKEVFSSKEAGLEKEVLNDIFQVFGEGSSEEFVTQLRESKALREQFNSSDLKRLYMGALRTRDESSRYINSANNSIDSGRNMFNGKNCAAVLAKPDMVLTEQVELIEQAEVDEDSDLEELSEEELAEYEQKLAEAKRQREQERAQQAAQRREKDDCRKYQRRIEDGKRILARYQALLKSAADTIQALTAEYEIVADASSFPDQFEQTANADYAGWTGRYLPGLGMTLARCETPESTENCTFIQSVDKGGLAEQSGLSGPRTVDGKLSASYITDIQGHNLKTQEDFATALAQTYTAPQVYITLNGGKRFIIGQKVETQTMSTAQADALQQSGEILAQYQPTIYGSRYSRGNDDRREGQYQTANIENMLLVTGTDGSIQIDLKFVATIWTRDQQARRVGGNYGIGNVTGSGINLPLAVNLTNLKWIGNQFEKARPVLHATVPMTPITSDGQYRGMAMLRYVGGTDRKHDLRWDITVENMKVTAARIRLSKGYLALREEYRILPDGTREDLTDRSLRQNPFSGGN